MIANETKMLITANSNHVKRVEQSNWQS